MFSNLTKLFLNEHHIIEQKCKIISHLLLKKNNPSEEDCNEIKSLLHFVKKYSDEFHHKKEESVLFPAIKNKHPITGEQFIQELLEHHEDFRDKLRSIETNFDNLKVTTVIEELSDYIQALLDHIAIENDELFPIVESIFTTDELERLYFACLDTDRQLGQSEKVELESFINEMRTL